MTDIRSKKRVSFNLKPSILPLNNPYNSYLYKRVKPQYPTKRTRAFRSEKTSEQILVRAYKEKAINSVDAGLHIALELCLSLGIAKTAAMTAYMHEGFGLRDIWATLDSGASLG